MPPRDHEGHCLAHAGIVAQLVEGEKKMDRLESKLDRMNWWVVLTLGSACASLGLLLINLVLKRGL
jgi:hypothetical protein